MSKHTITRLWIAGLIVLVAGLAVAGVSAGLMLAYGGHFAPATNGNGQTFVPTLDDFFWTTVGFIAAGAVIALAGGIVQLAAWVGALINANQLQDKTWFIVLLVGGILGLNFGLLGFAVMVAYLVAGPDSTASEQPLTGSSDLRPAPLSALG